MTRFYKTLAAAGLAGFLAFAPTGAAVAGEAMTSKQIKALFPGNFRAIVNGIIPVRFKAYRSGRLLGKMRGDTDRGRWSVRGGVLCIVLNKWMDGKARCARVTKSGGWYQVASVRFKKH